MASGASSSQQSREGHRSVSHVSPVLDLQHIKPDKLKFPDRRAGRARLFLVAGGHDRDWLSA